MAASAKTTGDEKLSATEEGENATEEPKCATSSARGEELGMPVKHEILKQESIGARALIGLTKMRRKVSSSFRCVFVFGFALVGSAALGEPDDLIHPNPVTRIDAARVKKICGAQADLGLGGELFTLENFLLYRSLKKCLRGRNEVVCETYVIQTTTNRCYGKLYTGEFIMKSPFDTNDSRDLRVAQRLAIEKIPEYATGSGTRLLLITESTTGAVFILETPNSFDVIRME